MADVDVHRLKDGREVVLRVAGPSDVPAIADLFAELSDDSLRSRFNGPCAPSLLTRLAQVGPPSGAAAILAAAVSDPAHLAGEARYVPSGPGVAELAVTVLDSYQGTGLGQLLLTRLVALARAAGIARLSAMVSLNNAPMLHLLEPYGWILAAATDVATASLEISAQGAAPGWPEGEPGRRVLVEQRSWFDSDLVARLRAAGDQVRVCLGPRSSTGRACPLVTDGTCRLAEEADVIVPLLPADDGDSAQVLEAHRRLWPGRLSSEP